MLKKTDTCRIANASISRNTTTSLHSLVVSSAFIATTMSFFATTIGFGATTMLKKRFHNHNNNQTNPKPQPKPKTEAKTQPAREVAHTNDQLQQPKKQIFFLKTPSIDNSALREAIYPSTSSHNQHQKQPPQPQPKRKTKKRIERKESQKLRHHTKTI